MTPASNAGRLWQCKGMQWDGRVRCGLSNECVTDAKHNGVMQSPACSCEARVGYGRWAAMIRVLLLLLLPQCTSQEAVRGDHGEVAGLLMQHGAQVRPGQDSWGGLNNRCAIIQNKHVCGS